MVEEAAPFVLEREIAPSVPILIAAPHGGRDYPQDVLDRMRDPDFACIRLEDRYIDEVATEVARRTGAALLVANAPRAVIDLNRAPDDIDWSMIEGEVRRASSQGSSRRRAQTGLGLFPRRLPRHGDIWRERLPSAEMERRIADIHQPYQMQLARTLASIRETWGAALLLDLHSMPPLKPRHASHAPAEFVLGDRFGASCDHALAAHVLQFFDQHHRPIAHNRPYSGGYVLDHHAKPATGLHGVQLEISRAAYLDARLDKPGARKGAVVRLLSDLVRSLAGEVAVMGDRSQLRHAAE